MLMLVACYVQCILAILVRWLKITPGERVDAPAAQRRTLTLTQFVLNAVQYYYKTWQVTSNSCHLADNSHTNSVCAKHSIYIKTWQSLYSCHLADNFHTNTACAKHSAIKQTQQSLYSCRYLADNFHTKKHHCLCQNLYKNLIN